MDERERLERFLKNWRLDKVDDDVFLRFKERLRAQLALSGNGDWLAQTPTIDDQIAVRLGRHIRVTNTHQIRAVSADPDSYVKAFGSTRLHEEIKESTALPQLLFVIQCMLWTVVDNAEERINDFVQDVRRAIDMTSGLPVRMVWFGGQPELVPRGVKELDAPLIEGPFYWLADYDKTRVHFLYAYRAFVQSEPPDPKRGLNELRRAMIAMCEQLTGSTHRTLRRYLEKMENWLDFRHVHPSVRDIVISTMGLLEDFERDMADHPEEVGHQETEFALYQCGSLLLLLVGLDRANKK